MTRHRLAHASIALAAAVISLPGVVCGDAPGLLEAARANDIQTVRALVADGTPVDAADGRGTTAMHLAAGLGYLELTRTLIGLGADVNARGALGNTPLHLAAQEGHTDIVDLLVAA